MATWVELTRVNEDDDGGDTETVVVNLDAVRFMQAQPSYGTTLQFTESDWLWVAENTDVIREKEAGEVGHTPG